MKKFIRKSCVAVLTLAVIIGAAACAPSTRERAAGDKIRVAATTTQLQDFVQQIGAEHIELTRLLKPGASAHSFDPSPADLHALSRADILVVNGAGLDDFIHKAVEASGFKGKIVTAADGIDLTEAAEITEKMRAGGGTADHAHGADSAIDPHIWTAPRYAAKMLQPITAALTQADSANAATYTANSQKYADKLKALDGFLKQQFTQVPVAKKQFVSTHSALLYFLHDYQIRFIGSVIPGFEDNAEPSAAEIKQLVANIKKYQVPAVFIESSSSDRLNNTVAKEAGVLVVTAPIYADSLAQDGDAASYIGATLANARTMLTAWGAQMGEVPSTVQ